MMFHDQKKDGSILDYEVSFFILISSLSFVYNCCIKASGVKTLFFPIFQCLNSGFNTLYYKR